MALATVLACLVIFVSDADTTGSVLAWLSLVAVPASIAYRSAAARGRGRARAGGGGRDRRSRLPGDLHDNRVRAEILGDGLPRPAILALVGAAAAFHPLRALVRGIVDELLFGSRPDPLGAAARSPITSARTRLRHSVRSGARWCFPMLG
jgi:hypothetical protein